MIPNLPLECFEPASAILAERMVVDGPLRGRPWHGAMTINVLCHTDANGREVEYQIDRNGNWSLVSPRKVAT